MPAVKDTEPVNPGAVVKGGARDRVVMLSLKADGSPDQVDPEIIGDKDAAKAAAVEQFRQQAVSAADQRERGVAGAAGDVSDIEDPSVEKLKKVHDKAAKDAESSAKKVIDSLHEDDDQ